MPVETLTKIHTHPDRNSIRSHTTLGIINKWRKTEFSFFSPSKFFFLPLGDVFFLSSHTEINGGPNVTECKGRTDCLG